MPYLRRMLQDLPPHVHRLNAQMMDRLGDAAKLDPPEDGTVTTLYVGSVTPSMHEEDIVEPFRPYGEVSCPRFSGLHHLLIASVSCLLIR